MDSGSQKIVSLTAYRELRAAQRPARPFLFWQPGIGYVRSDLLQRIAGRTAAAQPSAAFRGIGTWR